MNIYRGPESLPFYDERHEFVASVNPEKLEASIRDGSYIRFNISKEATERKAVCTARFDSEDIVPMISGLLSRLQAQQATLLEIKKLMKDSVKSPNEKIEKIQKLIKDI
jgi:hypothetical protein